MWFATTDEEAIFIFDLLAERNASEPMLEYARWLENCGRYRDAEFVRLELSPVENAERLKALRQELDERWLSTVTGRRFRRGDLVRILGGRLKNVEGSVDEVDARRARAGLTLDVSWRQTDLTWVDFCDLQMVEPASQGQQQS
jgi:hypothetical protein